MIWLQPEQRRRVAEAEDVRWAQLPAIRNTRSDLFRRLAGRRIELLSQTVVSSEDSGTFLP